jgi:hypothetical protein
MSPAARKQMTKIRRSMMILDCFVRGRLLPAAGFIQDKARLRFAVTSDLALIDSGKASSAAKNGIAG